MHESSYNRLIGCADVNATDENVYLHLNDVQCLAAEVSDISRGIFGILGSIIHGYVIFSYTFRQYERRLPIETLILICSCYDFFYCFGLVILWIIEGQKRYIFELECPVHFTITTFYQNSLVWVTLLLATNRFFAICRPRYYAYYFSNLRIKIYALCILVGGLIAALGNQANYCFIQANDSLSRASKIFDYISLFIYVAVHLPVIITTIVLYIKIRMKMHKEIHQHEFFNYLSDGALSEDIRNEKSYLIAILISSIITIPLLMADFSLKVLTILYSVDYKLFDPDDDGDIDNNASYTANLVIELLICLLFVINPFIFYAINSDFRLKLKRPVRELKRRMRYGTQMQVAELSTSTQPLN